MNTYGTSYGERLTTEQINRRSDASAKELIREQIEEIGVNRCERCGINDRHAILDVSHTISRKHAKESGESEKVWDKSNMEILCRKCHNEKDGTGLKFNNTWS